MALTLTPEQHARIEAAVRRIEQQSAAGLHVVVRHVSDRYALFALVWAAFAAFAVAVAAAVIWPDLTIAEGLLIQLPALVALAIIFEWLPIRLALVPRRVKHAHARQLAHREFAAHALAERAPRHQLLLFVSLAERYVEIIADRDTHALAPEGTWDNIVADFIQRMKAGDAAAGMLAAVEACGQVLATHHPRPPASS